MENDGCLNIIAVRESNLLILNITPIINFKHAASPYKIKITVDTSKTRQTVLGFGGMFSWRLNGSYIYVANMHGWYN